MITFLSNLRELLRAVPPVVWSGIVATLITLFGVWLQNRAHQKRQQQQLDHDASQKIIERERNLKKDVYLASAESLAITQEYLASLSNLTLPLQQIQQETKGVWKSIFKAYIIGDM